MTRHGRGLRLTPFVVGGAQERARRGGIENVPAIVGFGAAADELGAGHRAEEAATARALTDRVATNADWVRLKGLTVTAGGWDIGAAGVDHVLMEDLTLRGASSHWNSYQMSGTPASMAAQ